MTLLSELETELQRLQERKAQPGPPPPGSVPSTAPALSKPRLGPAPIQEPDQASAYKPTDAVGAGLQAAKNLFGSQGLKKRDYPYAYGAGAGGLVTSAGKGMGIAGREMQKLSTDDSPVLYAAEKAYSVMKAVSPVASAMGRKGVQIARDVKASRQVDDPDPLVREAQKPQYKLIHTLGEKLEAAEKPTMALGKRTKEFYDGLLSHGARELKNTPWYKAEGLGAKFLSASLQATESAPMMAVTAVAGAPIAGTLKVTGATKALSAGIQRLGVSKKWAGKTADWLSEGLAYSTPEGVLAGLANAEEVGKEITNKTHEELINSPKYLEYFNSTPGNLDLAEREGVAKQLLIEDAEVFALGATCAASMATGMLAGGGIFGSAGASSSFIMRRVMGFAKEGVQEFFQSGPGEKLPANIALKLFADPEQEIMQDVWSAAAAGAGPGALIGGFVGSGIKPSSPAEVLDTARAERLKLRDDSIKKLIASKMPDDKLVQMMKSPEALANYGLVPSDLQGLITNKARAQQELTEFNESLAAAPNDAVRQGMKSSFLGEAMERLQEQIQSGRPDDRQETKPEAGQAPSEAKEKGKESRTEVAVAKAQERVLETLNKKSTLNLADPKAMQTFDTELKKAYEDLGIAQEQAETGDRRVDVSPPVGAERRGDAERRVDPERRKRIEDMTPVELKKELLTNPLTGIPNRRAMEEAMQRATDDGKPKTVIFIDADSLKTINDLGGHEAGDALLKSLADAVKTVDPDLGCHISGDEFVILADNPEQAKEKAAKLDKILATKEIVFTLENGDEFTYSGLGASHGIAETLKEADRRMGLHKAEREEAGERVGRGEAPPGLRKTASGEGEVGVGPGQEEKGVAAPGRLLEEGEKEVGPLVKGSYFSDTNDPATMKKELDINNRELKALQSIDDVKRVEVLQGQIDVKQKEYDRVITKEKKVAFLAKAEAKTAAKKAAAKEKTAKKMAAAQKTIAADKKAALVKEKKLADEKKVAETKAAEKKAVEQEEEKQGYLKNIGIVDRQLKGFEGEILTGPRKKIHAGLVAERQRYIDQVNKLFPGTVKDDPGVSAAKGEVPEFVALLNKTKSGKVALQWIAKNSKIKSYREIAKRMLFHLPKVSLVIVKNSDQPGVPWQISHSKGLHGLRGEETTVYLKNYGEPQNRGMNELVFLHEMIHAATVAKIRRSIDPALKKSKLRADVKRLDVLHREIIQYLHDPLNSSSGKQLVVYRNWARRLNNTRELVAYGMTDPGLQKILDQIQFEQTTVWTKFVKIIADILGVSDHTALGELIRITDVIVAADRPPLSTFKDHSKALMEEMADTGSKAFKKWFGKSQVIDAKGMPLVVHHGTRQGQFDIFKSKYNKYQQLGFGIHFAENQKFADRYATGESTTRKGEEPYVFNGYLSIQNMLNADTIVLEGSPEFDLALKLAGKRMHTSKNEAGIPGVYLQNVIDSTSPQRAERLIREAGYDGVKYKAKIIERGAYGARKIDESPSYLVFNPNQIKSVDNIGTFDPGRPEVEMMTIDDLPPDQKKLFEEAFGTLVKQPAKTQVRRMQEEEQTVLDAAETSRDPSTREAAKKLKKLNRSSTEFKRTEKTQTVGWLDRILGLPEYSFAKDAAANRVMQIALKADEVKYSIQTSVTGNFGKIGERVQKDNSKAYESGKDYLLESDKTGVSFSMAMDKGTWNVVGLAGEILETKLSEADAISAMMDAEQAHLTQQGFSSDAIDFIMEFRGVTNRAFDVQVADLRQQLATAERYGLDEPRVAGEGTPTISEAIATIGDLRGSYFPRERPNRTYIIRASKKGADNVLLTYDGYLPENTESWDITNRIKEVINMGLPISREIKKLQAEGYEVNGPTLSPAPSEAVFDAPGIAASLDAFLNLAETSSKDEDSKAIQHLNRMLVKKIAELYKAKGSLSSRLHRVDDYTTGFETDPLKAALSHAQRVASGVTKRQTARDMILCFTGRDVSFSEYQKTYPGKKYLDYRKFVSDRRVDPTEQQDLYKDVKDYIHYALESNTSADRSLGYLKAAAVFMYLGFRIPSAAVNLTNMVMAVPATIAAHADVSVSTAFKEVATASAVYAAYRSNQLMHHGVSESVLKKVAASAEAMAKKAGKTLTGKVEVTPEDTMVLDDIAIRGWDQAHFNIEALKALQGYSGKTFNSVMSASMYMFGAAEKANRAVTILAAYKALKVKHPETAHEDLMNQAHHTSDRAHGIYGKAAKPFLVQKYKGLDLFYTFMKFQHNYMLNMLEVGIKYKNLPAALHMLAISAVLSGAGATLATPVIATLAKMFGFSDDPEEDMYAWTEEHLPAIMARMVRHGAFGLLNINFKGSMQMNNPFPTKLREVAGAPGAVILDVWDMAKHFRHREWSKGLEKGLPTFAETPVKGYRFYTEGVTTKTYSPVFYGKDQLKADELELFMMMFSFNTARLSGLREKQWKEKNVKGSFSKDRQSILRRLKKIKMSSDPSNISALARIQEEIDEFNLRVERAPSRYQVNYLTWTQINRSLRQAMKPSKFEKQRVLRVD